MSGYDVMKGNKAERLNIRLFQFTKSAVLSICTIGNHQSMRFSENARSRNLYLDAQMVTTARLWSYSYTRNFVKMTSPQI